MHRELIASVAAVVVVLLAAGCGGESGGAKTATIPECGFSIVLPPGWVSEQHVENEFYKRGDRKNSWGMAKFCPMSTLEAKTLSTRKFAGVSEFVKYLVEEERFQGTLAEVVSQRSLKVGEVQADAYEVIFKDKNGHYSFTMFIEMEGGEALQVFFTVPGEQYEEFTKHYSTAAGTIRLAKTKPVW